MAEPSPSALAPRDWVAIVVAMALPSAITWVYFFRAETAPAGIQLAVFGAVKVLQFALPVVWVFAVQRRGGGLPPGPDRLRGLTPAIAFGVLVAAAMFALYYGLLRSSPLLAEASTEIGAKISRLRIDRLWKYAALGVFYSLGHSLLEEYYWRWFVFGQLRRGVALWLAMAVSSLGFMAHHVLVLGKFFGFENPATWLFSACVAIGGTVWAWLYERSGSLVGPWLSHLLIDAAIFAIGYDLVRHLLV